MTVLLYGQQLPDFDLAIDPVNLDLQDIFDQLDTIQHHRKPVNLSFIKNEFPEQTTLLLETFYQKSSGHRLLRLSRVTIKPEHLYAMIEGWGTTYFRISDGSCIVINSILQGKDFDQSSPIYRECTY